MNQRELGTSGIQVSEIGLGSWQLGAGAWGVRDASECLEIIRTALDLGCNFFDTAPGYAGGHSEEILGRAFKGRREQVVLCTKFGHTAEGGSDFGVNALRPSLESSLGRLQTDYVDLLLLHNPPAEMLDGTRTPLYRELEAIDRC